MTTEDDFQNAIDDRPEDWHARLVFADWLDERGDPRASGYRAIAVLRRRPLRGKVKGADAWWWHTDPRARPAPFFNVLPADWFALLPPGEGNTQCWPAPSDPSGVRTRRACEDALALAFAGLPPARRSELLAPAPAARPKT